MQLYVWRKRTPIALYLADHTWVTSYDLRVSNYNNINQVICAQEKYWYCKGDFHAYGDFIGQVNYISAYANCLVTPNDSVNSNGSIIRYGIDGVCHQVSNQVLYRAKYPTSNLKVNKARGYKLSSLIYGTYGKNKNLWNTNKSRCLSSPSFQSTKSLLTIRANNFARKSIINKSLIVNLEEERLKLLISLEQEGTAIKGLLESANERTEKMNLLIYEYTSMASQLLEEDLFFYIFGIEPGSRVDLIDAEQFEFIS